MHRISLPGDTRIWTLEFGPIAVKQLSVATATVYSPFGKPSQIRVRPNGREKLCLAHLDTGQQFAVGESHEFMCRSIDNPKPRAISALAMAANPDVYLAPMPSRKVRLTKDEKREAELITALQESFDQFDSEVDEIPPGTRSMVFMHVHSVEDMFDKGLACGFYGMATRTSMAGSKIELDEGRPSCFPTKLLFNDGVDDMVNALIDKGVLCPALPYEQFLSMAKQTGVLFEGQSVRDLRSILGVLSINQEEDTWTVLSDDENTTVELAFIRT